MACNLYEADSGGVDNFVGPSRFGINFPRAFGFEASTHTTAIVKQSFSDMFVVV